MKKIVLLFVMALMSLSTFAINLEKDNVLTIEIIENAESQTTLELKFESPEELFLFDVENQINKFYQEKNFGELCTAPITVTVRIGVDSTYAEASVTVEGVSCDAIASEINRLKAELKAALQ